MTDERIRTMLMWLRENKILYIDKQLKGWEAWESKYPKSDVAIAFDWLKQSLNIELSGS